MLSKTWTPVKIFGVILLALGAIATIFPILSMMTVAIAEENMERLLDFLPQTLDIKHNFIGIVFSIAGLFFFLIGKFSERKRADK